MEFYFTKWKMWRKLLNINKLLEEFFNASTTPFKKYLETLTTRIPYSHFYFRPFFIDEIYMALGLWEPYVCRIFTPNKGDVVLDAGAHIGYYTLKAAQAVGDEGIVISVEPDPRNFKILQNNVRSNRLRNVKLINCALGSSAGYARLEMASNPLVSQLMKKSQNRNLHLIKVEVKTIDELCQEIGVQRLDWVKIDVEGGASDVLRGGFKILRRPTRILIEIPDNETLQVLAKLEYAIRPLLPSNSKLGYYYAVRKTS
jgi:FkbM family methyltransferase